MEKIVEYATVIHTSHGDESLEKLVNRKIQEGFQPYGFPSVAGATKDSADGERESDFIIVQAMVKYEN
jgi:hypothetical protein